MITEKNNNDKLAKAKNRENPWQRQMKFTFSHCKKKTQ